jgi:hypothetical protein
MIHQAPGHVPLECTAEKFGSCAICNLIATNEHYRRLFHPEEFPDAAPVVPTSPAVIHTGAGPVARPLPDIPLAGNVVEALAKRIGADRLAKLWEQWTGLPCGCEERKAKLNAATEKLLKWARWLRLV